MKFYILYFIFYILYFITPTYAQDKNTLKHSSKLKKVQQHIQTLQQQMQNTQNHYGKLQQELQQTEKDIGKFTNLLEKLKVKYKSKQQYINELNRQQKIQQNLLAKQRIVLASQIRAAYAMGHQDYFKILLNQQQPNKLSRVLTYYDYFNRARTKQIKIINKTILYLKGLTNNIESGNIKLTDLNNNKQLQKQQLEKIYFARKEVIKNFKESLENQQAKLKRLQKDEKQIKILLIDLPNVFNSDSFAKLKGKLPYPLQGKLINHYGESRNIGRLKWHGIKIAAEYGDKVRSVAAGRVVFSNWLRNFGQLIIIDHGNKYMSLYGYNQSLYKKTGDIVEAGEVIASVGNSGGQQQAALYFEIRYKGTPTDPLTWLN
jgi:septal ring factor EnvC (AmiA/AmiB activator)